MTWQWRQAAANILLKQPDNLTDLGPEDSHLKDGITGAYLAELIAALTDDRAYTLQDADMTLAALNLAQIFTAAQKISNTTGPQFTVQYDDNNKIEFNLDANTATITADGLNFLFRSISLVTIFERMLTATDSINSVASMRTTTTGDMVDGFGSQFLFLIQDNAGVSNSIGAVAAVRNGADNTGKLLLSIYVGGTFSRRIAADTTGVVLGTGILSTTTAQAPAHAFVRDAATNAVTEVLAIEHESTGNGAAGFGAQVGAYLESSTTVRALAGAMRWIWTNATHDARTAKLEWSLAVNAVETTLMTLYSTHLDHAHCYGSMYQDDTGTTVTVSATNTDYIVTGMTGGTVNQFTFQNNQELKCLVAGKYKVTWSCSFVSGSTNQEIEGAVGVNGTRQAGTSAHVKVTTANADQCMSGTGILTLAVNDLVQIVVRNETSTANIIVDHANLTLDWVGP